MPMVLTSRIAASINIRHEQFFVIMGQSVDEVENELIPFLRSKGEIIPEGLTFDEYYQDAPLNVLIQFSDHGVFWILPHSKHKEEE